MSVFAIADLHLALGVPNKSMEAFGKVWEKYSERMEQGWKKVVSSQDLVLIPGDISWGKEPEEALPDLLWIDRLPGTKLLLRGNHDYWWSSLSKLKGILPPSLNIIQNNAFFWNDIAIGGSRMWDTHEYDFEGYIDYIPHTVLIKSQPQPTLEEQEKIFVRELGRLESSLKQLKESAKIRIAMTHYPPIGPIAKSSRITTLLEKYKIQFCVFGHLHNVKKNIPLFGPFQGINYILTAADYIDFTPKKII